MAIAANGIVGGLLAAGRGTRFDASGARLKLLEGATCGPRTDEPLSAAADGWIVALADMPAFPLDVPGRIVQALRAGVLAAAPVYLGERGRPVGFAAELREELLSLTTGDTGARRSSRRTRRKDVDGPGRLLYDVDYLEEN